VDQKDERILHTVVLVHAHPDDETLWTGGLIAQLARQGDTRIVVVTCTRGERGEVITAPGTATADKGWLFGNHAALADYRTGELNAALAALGNGYPIEHYFLDELPLPDGAAAGELTTPQPSPCGPEGAQGLENQNTQSGNKVRYVDSGMRWLVEPSMERDDPEGGYADGQVGPEGQTPAARTSTGGIAEPDPAATDGFAVVPIEEPAARLANLLYHLGEEATAYLFAEDYVYDDIYPGMVVYTYEADGGYGHPDHIRAHQVTHRAFREAGDRLLHGHRLEDLMAMMLNEVTPRPVPKKDVGFSVKLKPVLPQVLNAMRAYASQVQNVTEDVNKAEGRVGWFALSNGVPLPLKAKEYYRYADVWLSENVADQPTPSFCAESQNLDYTNR